MEIELPLVYTPKNGIPIGRLLEMPSPELLKQLLCIECKNISYKPMMCGHCDRLICKDCYNSEHKELMNNLECPKCGGVELKDVVSTLHRILLNNLRFKCHNSECVQEFDYDILDKHFCKFDLFICPGEECGRELNRTEMGMHMRECSHYLRTLLSEETLKSLTTTDHQTDATETTENMDAPNEILPLNTKFISCSIDKSVIISNRELKEEQRLTLEAPALKIFLISEYILVTKTNGETNVYIQKGEELEKRGSLIGHESPNCIWGACEVDSGRVATCAADQTIRIWDLGNFSCVRVLRGHVDIVHCIIFYLGKLISGSEGGSLMLWGTDYVPELTISGLGGDVISIYPIYIYSLQYLLPDYTGDALNDLLLLVISQEEPSLSALQIVNMGGGEIVQTMGSEIGKLSASAAMLRVLVLGGRGIIRVLGENYTQVVDIGGTWVVSLMGILGNMFILANEDGLVGVLPVNAQQLALQVLLHTDAAYSALFLP